MHTFFSPIATKEGIKGSVLEWRINDGPGPMGFEPGTIEYLVKFSYELSCSGK